MVSRQPLATTKGICTAEPLQKAAFFPNDSMLELVFIGSRPNKHQSRQTSSALAGDEQRFHLEGARQPRYRSRPQHLRDEHALWHHDDLCPAQQSTQRLSARRDFKMRKNDVALHPLSFIANNYDHRH